MKLNFAVCLTALTFTISCSDQNQRTIQLPEATGKSGEIIVVLNSNHCNGAVGKKLRTYLAQPQAALPQDEPLFDIICVPRPSFRNVFERHRNIIQIFIDKKLTLPSLSITRDIHSASQLSVTLQAESDTAMIKLIDSVHVQIEQLFLTKDRQRTLAQYAQYRNHLIDRHLTSHFGFGLTVPQGFTLDVTDSTFLWMTYERNDKSQGIIIYTQPLRGAGQLNAQTTITYRDSLFRTRVPGPATNTFMQTEMKMYEPQAQTVLLDGQKSLEMRGLWRVQNDFMGGPFVSYSILDAANSRIINLYGYVYAPQNAKRDYMRQVDAILQSFHTAQQSTE